MGATDDEGIAFEIMIAVPIRESGKPANTVT